MTPQDTAPTMATAVQMAIERGRDFVRTAGLLPYGALRSGFLPAWVLGETPGERGRRGGQQHDHQHGGADGDGERRGAQPDDARVERDAAAGAAQRLVDDEPGEERRGDEPRDADGLFGRLPPARGERPDGLQHEGADG